VCVCVCVCMCVYACVCVYVRVYVCVHRGTRTHTLAFTHTHAYTHTHTHTYFHSLISTRTCKPQESLLALHSSVFLRRALDLHLQTCHESTHIVSGICSWGLFDVNAFFREIHRRNKYVLKLIPCVTFRCFNTQTRCQLTIDMAQKML